MRPLNSVVLSRDQIDVAIKGLKERGIVDVGQINKDINSGTKVLFIKPGGIFQRLRAWFSGASERKAVAEQVCARLQAVLGTGSAVEGLLNNVRKQILNEGRLTGAWLAKNLKALQNGEILVSVKDMPNKALGIGQQVRVLSGSPTQIESDRCIVSFDTAKELLGASVRPTSRPEPEKLGELIAWLAKPNPLKNDTPVVHTFTSKSSAAKQLVSCPVFNVDIKKDRTPGEMRDLIKTAIGDAAGAIVLEPQPDTIKHEKLAYSDEGLKAQIQAALDLAQDAEKKNLNRVITFVSPDKALLKRIQNLYAGLPKKSAEESDNESRPVQRQFVLDSDSDSDSSEDEELQLNKPDDGGTGVFPR